MPEIPQQPMTNTAQDILSKMTELPTRPARQNENAPLWRRSVAYAIDMFLVSPLYLFFIFLLTTTPVPQGERSTVTFFVIITSILLVLLSFGYFIYFEGHGGATLGKRTMKIKVIGVDGQECSYGKSAIRALLRILDILTWPILLFNSKHQRLGDILAKTWVVKNVV